MVDARLLGKPVPAMSDSEKRIIHMCGRCAKRAAEGSDQHDAGLMVCTRCHNRRYCSRECQKADWKMHKPACDRMVAAERTVAQREAARARPGRS